MVRRQVQEFLSNPSNEFDLTVYWHGAGITARQASPWLRIVRDLEAAGSRAAFRLWHPKKGKMHTKVYAGMSGGVVTSLLVGSSNLSDGEFSKNTEASLLAADPPQAAVLTFLRIASKHPAQTVASIEELIRRSPPPPPPPPPPLPYLRIGHIQHTFPMTMVYLGVVAWLSLTPLGSGTKL